MQPTFFSFPWQQLFFDFTSEQFPVNETSSPIFFSAIEMSQKTLLQVGRKVKTNLIILRSIQQRICQFVNLCLKPFAGLHFLHYGLAIVNRRLF
jgi:hypothetical protein